MNFQWRASASGVPTVAVFIRNFTWPRLWRGLEILAWAVFFLAAGIVLALRYWVLPDIERYRPDIVAAVSRTVGQPVAIGAIEAGWQGLRPRLRLADVRVLDDRGNAALVLPAVENVVSWRSLLRGELRLRLLAIEAPRLAVRRDAGGGLHVAGVRLGGGPGGEGRLLGWILAQDEIQVRGAEIEWLDELRGAPPLALSAVSLRVRNDGRTHALGLSARPPKALGTALEARVELSRDGASGTAGASPSADLSRWSGRGYVELGYTDLAGWTPWVDYPVDLRHGQGALRLWTTLRKGELVAATADLEVQSLVARLARELPLLELSALRGRLELVERDGGYELTGRNLTAVPAAGPTAEPTSFRASWRPAAEGRPERGAFSAKLVQLEPLAGIAAALPLPAALRKVLGELQPRGELLDARLEWTGSPEAPQAFSGEARFTGLAMKAHGAVPGFEGLSGAVEGTEARVSLTLASRASVLELPMVFPEPRLALSRLEGTLVVERGSEGFVARLASLGFANEHLEGRASGTYETAADGPGRIDLTASLERADGTQVGRYLPRGELMGPRTRAYLVEAIREGHASEARLRLRGDLRDFPFLDPSQGEFRVLAHVQDGRFAPGEEWPVIDDIDATLLFERDRMEITGRRGRILGATVSDVKVEIASFLAPEVHLLVQGRAEGPAAEYLRFIEASPVRGRIGEFTDGMRAGEGAGTLALALDIPLEGDDAPRVQGELSFSASTLEFSRTLPPVERAAARIRFTESTMELAEAGGRLFGGPLALRGGTRDGGLELAAQGTASARALAALSTHPAARKLRGAASYAATLSLHDGRSRVSVESSLQGVASTLPAPFAKRAADALPLRIDVASAESGRDRVSLALGRVARAEILRVPGRAENGAETGERAVQRASLWLSPREGEAVRVPERPGVLVYGSLDALDLDAWLSLLQAGEAGTSGAGKPPQTAGPSRAIIDLKLGELTAYGRQVHEVALRAGLEPAGWSARIEAREIGGELSYRNEGKGRLLARLDHLTLDAGAPGEAAGPERDLPALDIIAERFTYKDRALGRLELLADRAGADWAIEKLVLLSPEGSLTGSGHWRTGAPSQTVLDVELTTRDAGKLLERFGYPGLVRGGEARLQAELSWNGQPTGIDYPSLAGRVQLEATNGEFLEIEPGIGKLISLMSLQALPRRLALDFRDVFSKGFRFDRIRSAGSIQAGVMSLDDFAMEGPAARVAMSGQVDLARETQALAVQVRPALGDTASTVIGILNPLLLFPAAIAQRILKDPLGHIFAFHYAISGTWSDPKVERTRVDAQPIENSPGGGTQP